MKKIFGNRSYKTEHDTVKTNKPCYNTQIGQQMCLHGVQVCDYRNLGTSNDIEPWKIRTRIPSL